MAPPQARGPTLALLLIGPNAVVIANASGVPGPLILTTDQEVGGSSPSGRASKSPGRSSVGMYGASLPATDFAVGAILGSHSP